MWKPLMHAPIRCIDNHQAHPPKPPASFKSSTRLSLQNYFSGSLPGSPRDEVSAFFSHRLARAPGSPEPGSWCRRHVRRRDVVLHFDT